MTVAAITAVLGGRKTLKRNVTSDNGRAGSAAEFEF
jgi:hypothetical protein